MGRIYESEEDYQKAFEEDFRAKCDMVNMYYGSREETTLDGEWTHSELKDDLWEEANKILVKDGWLKKHEGRAVKDTDLLHEEFIVQKICDTYDLIEVYNRAYDKHRNDKPLKFGIHYFDEVAHNEILKILKNNLVTN